MDTFFKNLKKGLVFSIILVFAFVFTYVPQNFNEPPQAQALDFDTDVMANISTAVSAAANVTLTTKDTVLDGIFYAIGKTIISSLIGSIINWVNSGFEGSPAFVTDLKRSLLEFADRAAGEFIKGLGDEGSFICSPFRLNIQVALAVEYQRAREGKPIETCTLSGIIDNIEDFYEGNFESGGWKDWITVTSRPEKYTPYGQLLTAQTAMRAELVNAKGEKLVEIDWGQGFLSGKICETIEGSSGPKENCTITKPGRVIADTLNKSLGAGQDQLIAADEVNELIAALIGQLANQAIVGTAGLLGLSSGTGLTYGGFSAGSYIDQAIAQSSQIVGSTTKSSSMDTSVFTESIDVQNDLIALANNYITRLNTYANNKNNPADKRSNARLFSQNAATARDKAIDLIPKIESIRNEYTALEAEKTALGNQPATDSTRARQQQIALRQADLYNNFIKLTPYSRQQLTDFEEAWKSIFI
ncbi:MAG: hypothetical protein RL538_162 [Candidatus Parcubacteria bacterium]|jgi:hypothetical protein